MKQNSLHTVAWHAPENFHQTHDIQRVFGSYKLEAVASDGISGQADIKLFHVDNANGMEALTAAYQDDSQPTLVIVRTREQEVEVFGFLRDGDDVCRDDAPLASIAARLHRILRRSWQVQLESTRRLDPLTGVLSRWAFNEEMVLYFDSYMSFSSETRALVMLDLDWFKRINDVYGHGVGDKILQEVARLLMEEIGPGDKVGRLGGEEFVLLISRYNVPTVLDSVDKIRQRLANHEFKSANDDCKFYVTASFGLAVLGSQPQIEESFKQADMALYQAKENGRNNVVCFESMLDPEASADTDLHIQHFENVARVVNERMTNLITFLGRRLIETAREEANNDALTQLHNRRYFDNRLSREFETAKKHGRLLTVALMDIDHFHDVNITHGWPTGDHVLRIFSKIASENIRLVDWLARYGGEEFCLVMLDTSLDEGIAIADRIRVATAETNVCSLDHKPVRLTVSIGVATMVDDIESPVSLVQKASQALIDAKNLGRNRVCA